MATEVILPRVDMDMTEGKIAFWYVKNGDLVVKGQTLFDIETDKAAMEVEATVGGVISDICGEIGAMMPVGSVVAWIRNPGEAELAVNSTAEPEPELVAAVAVQDAVDLKSALAPTSVTVETAVLAAPAVVQTIADSSAPGSTSEKYLLATPLARDLASTRGIELRDVIGSGAQGQVFARDVPAARDALAAPAARTAEADIRLHLHWWQRGNGAPILMLHGFGTDHSSWRPLIQQIPARHPVVGIDLHSHGKSAIQSIKSMDSMAREILNRLDQEGITAFHVVGHSLGGGIALAISALQPQRVLSMTLLAPAGLGSEINGEFIEGLTHDPSEAALKVTLSRLFTDQAILTNSFVTIALQQLQSPGRRAALTEMADQFMGSGIQSESLRHVLTQLEVPVKVIWGLADKIIPYAHSKGLPGAIALHSLPAIGHLPQVEAAPLVARLLLQQISASSAAS